MKRFYLGTLAVAALSVSASGALAAAHSGGDMTSVTCEQFLALPAADQEMHATALTTANSSGSSSMSADATSSATSDSSPGSADSGADTASGSPNPTDSTSEPSMPSEGVEPDSQSNTGSTDAGGDMTDMMSPTVVALVTICENTQGDMGASAIDGSPSTDEAAPATSSSSGDSPSADSVDDSATDDSANESSSENDSSPDSSSSN